MMDTADNAARAIVERLTPLPPTDTAILDAVGLVLADDIISPIDSPYWDNSAMDGYAARSADLDGDPPIALQLIEEIPAGAFPIKTVGPGQCARVFTGAPVPKGADCVIRQEDTTTGDDKVVQIEQTRDRSRNVRKRGEDYHAGDKVLERGTTIGPAAIGVLVSLAMDRAPTHRRPVVAYLASGDEIADLDERSAILEGRKIASSNSYALRALILEVGGVPKNLGIAKDDPVDITRRLRHGGDADLIVTSAGVSVGEHDYLHQVLADLDMDRVFWRTRMRPGAPAGFGIVNGLDHTPWIGLPGNPVSNMVTFELFARPAIRRLMGQSAPFRRTVHVIAGEEITLGPKLKHFLRVALTDSDHGPRATLTGPQGSGILTSMTHADALMIVPEDVSVVEEGQTMNAIVLNDPNHVAEVPW